jgi:lysozyme
MIKYPNAIRIIEDREGLRLKPYLDPRPNNPIPTIGLGTITYPDGRKVTMQDKPITKEQAYEYMNHHINTIVVPAINRQVKVDINKNELEALISFVYNIGQGNFSTSTMRRLLNAGEPRIVVANEFDRWNKAGGKVLAGLVTRRRMEKELFLTPMKTEYNEDAIPVLPKNWLADLIALIVAFFTGKQVDPVPEAPQPEPIVPVPLSLASLVKQKNPTLNVRMIDSACDWIKHSAIKNKDIMTFVDFNLPSWQHRMFLIDCKTGALIDQSPCAHGTNSDPKHTGWTVTVSNVSGSHQSSKGAMVYGEGYTSPKKSATSFNISRRIDGLEQGINHLVRPRAIVLHDASYVTLARMNNKTLGRSHGCFVPTYEYLKKHNSKLQGTLLYVQHG